MRVRIFSLFPEIDKPPCIGNKSDTEMFAHDISVDRKIQFSLPMNREGTDDRCYSYFFLLQVV